MLDPQGNEAVDLIEAEQKGWHTFYVGYDNWDECWDDWNRWTNKYETTADFLIAWDRAFERWVLCSNEKQ